jgi:hypothetical protein
MQIIKRVFSVAVFLCPIWSLAQTTNLPEGSKEYQTIDRLEIKYGKNTQLNFSTQKPYTRKAIVQQAEFMDSVFQSDSMKSYSSRVKLSPVDQYNIQRLLMDNSEWVTGSKESLSSKKPLWNKLYTTPGNLFEVNTKDFFLAVNPVLNFQGGTESGQSNMLYYNKRGITVRGLIANKIGFSTTISDNQERGPQFFTDYVIAQRAVPGEGFYKKFGPNGFDYFDGRGYISFGVTKYIDVQFGYDKNTIGNGYRSLFLDNSGNSALFLKLNTKIWKFNYENLFMELIPTYNRTLGDKLLDRKYAAMHHLSIDVTKWLNLGLFESVIFGRENHFDFQYLNPIIFLRHVEGTVGSPDNAMVGFDFKANVAKQFQFYGQFVLDEFHANEIFKNNGSWLNKYGYQLGVKYVDAFKINNLDLQFETNRVRPFTYSHYDSVDNYTHYNQPLAHPLGANFQEFIGIVKYQPMPKWHFDARIIYYYKGLDSANQNFGGDIFRLYNTRSKDEGFFVGDGLKNTVLNAALTVGYELKENLFIEGNYLFRKATGLANTNVFYIGIRLNSLRRDYNFK